MRKRIEFLLWWAFFVIANLVGCMGPQLAIVQHDVVHVVEKPVVAPRDVLVAAYNATVQIGVTWGSTAVKQFACGSGVLVAPNRILTAGHVLEHGADPVLQVTFDDGKTFFASVVRIDVAHDLALVEFAGHASVEPLSFASEEPPLMSTVWNIGSADCIRGVVSQEIWSTPHVDGSYLLRTISGGVVYPGMSGGPVVDGSGALVGINDAVHAKDLEDDDSIITGMGYAVDWINVKQFMEAR